MNKSPCLCQIYSQDVINFLPRKKIERMRQASRGLNASVVGMGPTRLPRRVHHVLELMAVGAFPADHSLQIIGKSSNQDDGPCRFAKGLPRGRNSYEANRITRNFRTRKCCQDVIHLTSPITESLMGQCLFVHRPRTVAVDFKAFPSMVTSSLGPSSRVRTY